MQEDRPARALWLSLLLVGAACGAPDSDASLEAPAPPPQQGGPTLGTWSPEGRLVRLILSRAAVDPPAGQPAALAYLPRRFDPASPLSVIVHLHGWHNCIENVLRPDGLPCSPGGPARDGYNLSAQLEASGRNAILLLPEIAYDQASSTAGRFDEPGFFRGMLAEVLAGLRQHIGDRGLGDVAWVAVSTHSGGYNAAASIVAKGGVPVAEVLLLDSLYARQEDFVAWMQEGRADLGSSPWNGRRRFLSVYTAGGGTYDENLALAREVGAWGLPQGALQDDRTSSTWDQARYKHGLLFKFSALTHDGTARYYFQQFLATSQAAGGPSS